MADDLLKAVADANAAVKADPSNPAAYLQKGKACFAMEEFETARDAFEKGASLAPSDGTFRTWLRKCDAELSAEAGDAPVGLTSAPPAASAPASAPVASSTTSTAPAAVTAAPAPDRAAPAAAVAPRVRYEWCQSASFVDVDLFVKSDMYDKAKASIDIKPQSLSVSVPLISGSEFTLELDLCSAVDVSQCKVEYLRTKIEIKLKKAVTEKWNSLELKETQIKTSQWADASAANKHQYPSSAPKKIDWTRVEKEIEEDKLEGEAALNKVFQDIFGNGTDEQKRAMMKSFTESGGTVLSTNWDEVGKKKVEGTPPPGLDMKRWDELQK